MGSFGGDKELRKLFACAGAAALVTWSLYKRCTRAHVPEFPKQTEEALLAEARRQKQAQAHLTIRIIEGLSAGLVFEFTGADVVTVGRRSDNRIELQDTGISGAHCELSYSSEDDAWLLADRGSLNGTFLNRVLIASDQRTKSEHRHLKSKDRVQIGEATTFEVTCAPSWQPEPAVPASDDVAQVLLALLDANPLDAEIRGSITPFSFTPCRMTGCQIQKTGARARASGACEDTFSALLPLPGSTTATLCLCDGHCGADSSNAVQDILPRVLAHHALGTPAGPDLDAALTRTFLALDAELEGRDGATMSLVLLDSDAEGTVSVQAANVGDSAVVCADFQQMMKMCLTRNHRVKEPSELARLKEAGSQLTHNDTRIMGLNLSRSLGDHALKEMNPGFSADPYVSASVRVEASDSLLLILASDGLWDVTNEDLVIRIAHRVLSAHPGDLDLLCQCLMYHAISRRSLDDITIVVVLVGDSPVDGPAA